MMGDFGAADPRLGQMGMFTPVGDVVSGPEAWFNAIHRGENLARPIVPPPVPGGVAVPPPGSTRMLGPIERFHSDNPDIVGQSPQKYAAENKPSSSDTAQTSFPDSLTGGPKSFMEHIAKPEVRSDANTVALEKFGAGMGLAPGTAQGIYNRLMLEAENGKVPMPTISSIKYMLALLRQKGEL